MVQVVPLAFYVNRLLSPVLRDRSALRWCVLNVTNQPAKYEKDYKIFKSKSCLFAEPPPPNFSMIKMVVNFFIGFIFLCLSYSTKLSKRKHSRKIYDKVLILRTHETSCEAIKRCQK